MTIAGPEGGRGSGAETVARVGLRKDLGPWAAPGAPGMVAAAAVAPGGWPPEECHGDRARAPDADGGP